ncbi:unnamed protein product [Linum tenue]|uniref:J domain-containing protein n=1 Tax=Linum tenue TaxID=586396 RepID=A0AAV0JAZ2_9ROSI|nr:unnamed protein product [Linum tenue]
MNDTPNGGAPDRAEAERLLGVAGKLLQSRDFTGSKDFAVLAQETDPLLDGSDQILAIADVLLSSDKKISDDHHHDWYSILQLDPAADFDLIKKQYRRLALLLHPDKNKFPFADHAFKLVADAWAVLSDSSKKSPFDRDFFSLYTKVDLSSAGDKMPVRRSQRSSSKNNHPGDSNNNNSAPTAVNSNSNSSSGDMNHSSSRRSSRMASFWTLCPYCYIMYEYPRVYEDCCLRCQKCERAFHAALIHSLPPMVPGKESYYCSWGVFPLGFMLGNGDKTSASDAAAAASGSAFVNWMPPMFGGGGQQQFSDRNGAPPPPPPPPAAAATTFPVVTPAVPQSTVSPSLPVQGSSSGVAPRKRGRPRKNPLPGQT